MRVLSDRISEFCSRKKFPVTGYSPDGKWLFFSFLLSGKHNEMTFRKSWRGFEGDGGWADVAHMDILEDYCYSNIDRKNLSRFYHSTGGARGTFWIKMKIHKFQWEIENDSFLNFTFCSFLFFPSFLPWKFFFLSLFAFKRIIVLSFLFRSTFFFLVPFYFFL